MKNIKNVFSDGLCCSCGICAGNCPQNCITMSFDKGIVRPLVSDKCTYCGMCLKVCPKSCLYDAADLTKPVTEYVLGNYIEIFGAKNRNKNLLKEAASGGVATGIIETLLNKGFYDCAFLVHGYSYDSPLTTFKYAVGESLEETTKSRYLTVSHENTIAYICKHPNERVIVVGTGCVIQGFLNTIESRHLKRENILLVGLFCEKTMNYNVIKYFEQHRSSAGKTIKLFYFKHKAAGGWPGDVRIIYDDNTVCDLPSRERMRVKDYFSLERCLYCLDKLNRGADISLGDNYIEKNKDVEGISSVIIRTKYGRTAWNICKDQFQFFEDSPEELLESQLISEKEINYSYAILKGLYGNTDFITPIRKITYRLRLRKIKKGRDDSKQLYEKINRDILWLSLLRKPFALLKRKNGS